MAVFQSSIYNATNSVKQGISVSTEDLIRNSEELVAANSRIQTEITNMMYDYEIFCSNFQGDSRYAFVGAMQTFWGKNANLNRIISQSADTLTSMSGTVARINEEAGLGASTED